MIQRVQSLYLFLTSFFYFLYWFFGYQWYEKGFVFFKKTLFGGTYIMSDLDFLKVFVLLFDITTITPLVISVICLITIFCFKNRLVQVRLTRFSFYLSLFMLIYSVFYFSISLFYLINLIDSIIIEFLLYAALFNPLICCYLLYNSIKKINQDENLINSINRLR